MRKSIEVFNYLLPGKEMATMLAHLYVNENQTMAVGGNGLALVRPLGLLMTSHRHKLRICRAEWRRRLSFYKGGNGLICSAGWRDPAGYAEPSCIRYRQKENLFHGARLALSASINA